MAVSNDVVVLECWYDSTGHRIAKREIIGTQTNAVQYVWDGWNLVAVLDEDGALKEFYTRGVGIAGDIGTLVAVTHYTDGSPTATYYLHNNHRGDVIMAREDADTVAMLDYAPYGELRSRSGSYAPRFRFSSKEYDASTGLYHFPYRYYAPQWARWLSRDPHKNAEFLRERPNLYDYVGNKPIVRLDPLGLVSAAECWDQYNKDVQECYKLKSKCKQALCFAKAMDFYASCLAEAAAEAAAKFCADNPALCLIIILPILPIPIPAPVPA
jgi:RHS repeat-associated protein